MPQVLAIGAHFPMNGLPCCRSTFHSHQLRFLG
jgi:hypothetical protein